jgi:serine/threonine protein kinase
MTAYVATRWYRAPEVMLSFTEYTTAIDVWSVGTIFAEMLGRRVLFPGKNYVEQMGLVLNVLGTPPSSFTDRIGSERARSFMKAFKVFPPVPFSKLYPEARLVTTIYFPYPYLYFLLLLFITQPTFVSMSTCQSSPPTLPPPSLLSDVCSGAGVDLLSSLLTFDPLQRCTVHAALRHPFLTRYHDPEKEPVCLPFNFDFEVLYLRRSQLFLPVPLLPPHLFDSTSIVSPLLHLSLYLLSFLDLTTSRRSCRWSSSKKRSSKSSARSTLSRRGLRKSFSPPPLKPQGSCGCHTTHLSCLNPFYPFSYLSLRILNNPILLRDVSVDFCFCLPHL